VCVTWHEQRGKAIEYHTQRLAIAKEVGDRAGEGAAYGSLGCAYNLQGSVSKAIEHDGQHLAIAKQVGDRAGEGAAYANLGNACQSQGGCKAVSEPEEIGQAVQGNVGSVMEETNADSVRAQVSFIESLFATSGSPSKVAAGAKESGTAAGGPERRNAERQGADASGQRVGVHGAGSGEAAVKKKAEVRVVKNALLRTSAVRDTTAARTVQAVWETSFAPSFPPSFPPSLPPIGQDADDDPEPASAKHAMGGGTLLRTSAIRDTTAVRTARAVWETFEQDADDGAPACVPR
jgi:hypothetical protein